MSVDTWVHVWNIFKHRRKKTIQWIPRKVKSERVTMKGHFSFKLGQSGLVKRIFGKLSYLFYNFFSMFDDYVIWKKNHYLKSLGKCKQLWSFLHICKIVCHYRSLTPSNSMHQKSNNGFKESYPHIRMGTLESIPWQKSAVFVVLEWV